LQKQAGNHLDFLTPWKLLVIPFSQAVATDVIFLAFEPWLG
jgi:hypothetical protein